MDRFFKVIEDWLQPLQPLFRGLVAHPVLLLVALLFLAIAWGWLGRAYGLTALFWHKSIGTQFLNGLGVSLLFAQLCFVAYLRDLDQSFREEVQSQAETLQQVNQQNDPFLTADYANALPKETDLRPPVWLNFWQYLGTAWGLALLALLVPVFWAPRRRWPLVFGVGAAVGVVFALVFFLRDKSPPLGYEKLPTQPNDWGVLLNWVVTFLFALLFLTYAVTFLLFKFDPTWKASWGGWGLIVFALVLFFLLVVAGVLRTFVGLPPDPVESWRHRMALNVFGAVFAAYVLIALLSWTFPWDVWTKVVPPFVALCLFVVIVVVVDNTIRFHFQDAIVPAWLALLGLGVLANSYEPRRLRFLGLDYARIVHPAALDPRPDGLEPQQFLAGLREQCHRLFLRLEEGDQNSHTTADAGRDQMDEATLRAYHESLVRLLAQREIEKLENWKKLVAAGSNKPKLAVVAVVGGANRAALWTAVVLTKFEELHRDLPHFSRHIRVITGASGGMVGACFYAASLRQGGGHGAPQQAPLSAGQVQDKIAGDHLTTVFHRAVFRDLPLLFWPFSYLGDRGQALEEAWKKNLAGALDIPFKELAQGEKEGWRPSLIVTPMLVEDGRQLIISNLFLPFLTENAGNFLTGIRSPAQAATTPAAADLPRPRASKQAGPADEAYRYSLSGLEFFHLFPEAWPTFKLSTAARMNASFPYVSPAVDLPTEPRRRVVDAGYYDNYGIKTAAAWIYHHKTWLEANTSGVVLIQIRDLASETRRLFPGGDPRDQDRWDWSRGIEWLTGPLVGAASARESVMSFRNDEQVENLSDLFNASMGKGFFTTVVFSFGDEIALNWYLGPDDVKAVKDSWDAPRNQEALNALKKWW
jgi:hypothetical protein